MKKIILTLTIIIALSFGTYAQNVNIPDANFKTYLVGNAAINTNGDTEIQVSEASAFTGTINCPNLSISDLTGIETFINLNKLFCSNNLLDSIDLTNNTVIATLSCYYNSIAELDLSQNPSLAFLICHGNSLTNLDLSNNTALINVRCGNQLITKVDVSNSPSLTIFQCSSAALFSLNLANGNNSNFNKLIVANNPNLICIQVDDSTYSANNWTIVTSWFNVPTTVSFSINCPCTVIDIPDANFKAYLVGNTAINTNGDTEIQCSEASAFSGTIVSDNLSISDLTGIEAFTSLDKLSCHHNSLTSLNLDSNTVLREVYCHNNSIATLEFSLATNLSKIYCYNNSLNTLDVSSNYLLAELSCGGNNLSSINVLSNIFLTTLQFGDNTISSIDLSGNPDLFQLNCNDNTLTTLDVSSNTSLQYLHCYNNQIADIDVSLNTSLVGFTCNDNQLTSLNVANGNNSNISNTSFKAGNNPNLTCIEVDDTTYSNNTWTNIDAIASFSESCGVVLVNTITVQGEAGVSTISTNGGTLQMEAAVLPVNTADDTFTWSVTNGTGSATISVAGLLTATAEGTVTVTATANDASGIIGSKTIMISNQSVGISTISFQNLRIYPNPTNNLINISVLEKVHSIRIMDITGKVVKDFNNKEIKLNISEFTAGIYFLEIANSEKKSMIKIIKK
jgi:Leucine-rich repeat (LRR) protein